MENQLAGKWEHSFFASLVSADAPVPSDAGNSRAILSYSFRKDGTYSKTLKISGITLDEQGNWELSKDGKYLLTRSCGGSGSKAILVKHLELDELVLEQSLDSEDTTISAGLKHFYFNKQ